MITYHQPFKIKIDKDVFMMSLTEKVIYEVVSKDLISLLLPPQPDFNNHHDEYQEWRTKANEVRTHSRLLMHQIMKTIEEERKRE